MLDVFRKYSKQSIFAAFMIVLVFVFVVSSKHLFTTEECDVKLQPSNLFNHNNLRDNYEPNGYVAHAFGSIDSNIYTNSKEAFERSYQLGFRIFEVDLVLLRDGTVFLAHDNYERYYGLGRPFWTTNQSELTDKMFLDKYTPLTGSQLLDLMDEYQDIYIIADPKYENVKIVEALVAQAKQQEPSVLERLIPHIAGSEELCQVHSIYPFKDYMLALYRANNWKLLDGSPSNELVTDFVKKHHINAVMMWWDRRYTPEPQESLSSVGAVTYVHSLDNPEKITSFRRRGVGVYSNGFFPKPSSLSY